MNQKPVISGILTIIKPIPGVVKPSKAAKMIYKNIPIDNNKNFFLNVPVD